MGHTVPFGFIWLVLMHTEVLGWVEKISFWEKNLKKKEVISYWVGLGCFFVGFFDFFFIFFIFDTSFSFSSSFLRRSEASRVSSSCKVALLCLFLRSCCWKLCGVAGFGAVPSPSSSPWGQRTGNKLQCSFGISAFWRTARGTPSWGKQTVTRTDLCATLTFRIMTLWSNRFKYSLALILHMVYKC